MWLSSRPQALTSVSSRSRARLSPCHPLKKRDSFGRATGLTSSAPHLSITIDRSTCSSPGLCRLFSTRYGVPSLQSTSYGVAAGNYGGIYVFYPHERGECLRFLNGHALCMSMSTEYSCGLNEGPKPPLLHTATSEAMPSIHQEHADGAFNS